MPDLCCRDVESAEFVVAQKNMRFYNTIWKKSNLYFELKIWSVQGGRYTPGTYGKSRK